MLTVGWRLQVVVPLQVIDQGTPRNGPEPKLSPRKRSVGLLGVEWSYGSFRGFQSPWPSAKNGLEDGGDGDEEREYTNSYCSPESWRIPFAVPALRSLNEVA